MRERIVQGKKAASSVSIPTLKQPTRGFGLDLLNATPAAATQAQPINKPITHDISRISLRPQAKLTIGQPGDSYEQEADSVAQQVMQRMAQPGNRQSIQRQEAPEEEEELQMKPLDISTLQRQEAPEEEEELQMSPMVQRQGQGGMAATSDLETSINQARGGGQPLGDNIRKPMEQAFGADFGGVKVHTDSRSDQLNQSIQARAFTTGQDVFFRQGEYNPGSRGGQELLAHELTHVVQQSGGVVQRDLLQMRSGPGGPPAPVAKLKLHADTETNNRSDLSFKELQNAQVGHSWVSLEYTDRKKIPKSIGQPTQGLLKSGSTAFGFWPLVTRASDFTTEEQQRIDHGQTPGAGASNNPAHRGFSMNPLKNVPGRVEEPDTAHTPKGTKEYDLTQAQVGSLISYVNSKRSANYNLYTFNCTTFAVESIRSAGQVAPSGSSWGICLPNALYKDLYQMKKRGDKSVTVAPLESGERHE
ncbi:DUF4157 domain-containing protein [Dolichospermum sp. LEGE 00246]|uniref:eCIS core domain-containing protein n=1 Tax=Dolichospermum sp. LEGE 00246 TaxID=1828605 RepID=UPI00187E1C88|nr:DUF4157 domain-containing protein [Dolichospermum sp. LEGE 00246]MBE9257573.1 DUF4157 domain-containing protein [Dolichospermum sp. LEGE 00246]